MDGRVLVVEDDESIRDLVVEILTDAGYATHAVGDGESAIAALWRERPLAIVLDVGLPIFDGHGVAQLARTRHRGVPIVVVTANYQAELDAREIGATTFVTKPFDVDTLLGAVRRATRSAESLSQDRIDTRDRRAREHDREAAKRGASRQTAD
jgi:DNA-binding response OmpR family regulator